MPLCFFFFFKPWAWTLCCCRAKPHSNSQHPATTTTRNPSLYTSADEEEGHEHERGFISCTERLVYFSQGMKGHCKNAPLLLLTTDTHTLTHSLSHTANSNFSSPSDIKKENCDSRQNDSGEHRKCGSLNKSAVWRKCLAEFGDEGIFSLWTIYADWNVKEENFSTRWSRLNFQAAFTLCNPHSAVLQVMFCTRKHRPIKTSWDNSLIAIDCVKKKIKSCNVSGRRRPVSCFVESFPTYTPTPLRHGGRPRALTAWETQLLFGFWSQSRRHAHLSDVKEAGSCFFSC